MRRVVMGLQFFPRGGSAHVARNLATSPDTHLSILELTRVRGAVRTERPLTIIPGDPLEDDEAILPYGYDPHTAAHS